LISLANQPFFFKFRQTLAEHLIFLAQTLIFQLHVTMRMTVFAVISRTKFGRGDRHEETRDEQAEHQRNREWNESFQNATKFHTANLPSIKKNG
jgi:hypothetical protein